MNKELRNFLLPILWVVGFITLTQTNSPALTVLLGLPLSIGVMAAVLLVVQKVKESMKISKELTAERAQMIEDVIIDENYFLIKEDQG